MKQAKEVVHEQRQCSLEIIDSAKSLTVPIQYGILVAGNAVRAVEKQSQSDSWLAMRGQ